MYVLEAFKKLNMPLKGVFGNNDQGEIEGLRAICSIYNFDFNETFRLDIALDKKIYTVHDPLVPNLLPTAPETAD